jgi:hypothetical protein
MIISDSTIYGIAIATIGLIALIVRYAFRSKCIKCGLCYGLIQIERNVNAEVEEMEFSATHPQIKPQDSLKNINNV